VPYAYFYSCR